MRKLAVLFFLAMLLLGSAMAESTDVEHLLWGIPFGISPEECVNMFYEAKNIRIEESEYVPGYWSVAFGQDISFTGHPVDSIVPTFWANQMSDIKITFTGATVRKNNDNSITQSERELITVEAERFVDVIGSFSEEYGDPTYGPYISLGSARKDTYTLSPNYPAQDQITDALLQNEKAVAWCSFDNIEIYLSTFDGLYSDTMVSVAVVYAQAGTFLDPRFRYAKENMSDYPEYEHTPSVVESGF